MNIVTVMNFVRGCEPRNPELDLVLPVKKQMELNNKYGFDYTVSVDGDISNCDDNSFELGKNFTLKF